MKTIIHTCLLAVRLIFMAGGREAASLDLFSNVLMNRAFNIVYYDTGMYAKKSETDYYYVEQKVNKT